jgi:hypothetical protein
MAVRHHVVVVHRNIAGDACHSGEAGIHTSVANSPPHAVPRAARRCRLVRPFQRVESTAISSRPFSCGENGIGYHDAPFVDALLTQREDIQQCNGIDLLLIRVLILNHHLRHAVTVIIISSRTVLTRLAMSAALLCRHAGRAGFCASAGAFRIFDR